MFTIFLSPFELPSHQKRNSLAKGAMIVGVWNEKAFQG